MSDNEALRITCLEPGCDFYVATSRGDDAEHLAGLMKAHGRIVHPVIPPPAAADLPEDYFTHGQELWVFRGVQGWDRVVFVAADPGDENFSVVTHEGEPVSIFTDALKLSPPLEDEPRLEPDEREYVIDGAPATAITVIHPNAEINAVLESIERNPWHQDIDEARDPLVRAGRRWRVAIKEQAG